MKKLGLLLAVAFSVSMFSCGGSDKKADADTTAMDTVVAVEEVAVVVDSAACDSAAADTAVAEVAAVVAE